MADVDRAIQYSVEVKSRFSLFLDDPLSNEDPDLLQNRILNERAGRKKKEKPLSVAELPIETDAHESVPRQELQTSHVKVVIPPKQMKDQQSNPPTSETSGETNKGTDQHQEHVPRGRGGPRGFNRGGRSRGQSFRPAFTEGPPGDLHQQSRDGQYEPRGRGRGVFARGRGNSYTDYREFERPMGHDRMGPRNVPQRHEPEPTEQTEALENPQVVAENGDSEIAEVNGTENNHEMVNGVEEAEEPKRYTLQEYKAMISSTKPSVALATKGSRKANDGKDVFANMVAHKKNTEPLYEEFEIIQQEKKEELPFEINMTFTDRLADRVRDTFGGRGTDRASRGTGNRSRGGRGSRGGFRGASRGRGFARGGAFDSHTAPPPIYSDQDFPSLK